MKRLIAVLALSACTACEHADAPAPSVSQTPAESPLSEGASKIVADLRARPDIDKLCGGGEAFRDAMRETVIKLMMSGEIAGNPRPDAELAANFLHAHCGQPEAAHTTAATPGVSSGSP